MKVCHWAVAATCGTTSYSFPPMAAQSLMDIPWGASSCLPSRATWGWVGREQAEIPLYSDQGGFELSLLHKFTADPPPGFAIGLHLSHRFSRGSTKICFSDVFVVMRRWNCSELGNQFTRIQQCYRKSTTNRSTMIAHRVKITMCPVNNCLHASLQMQ